jgi:uncharacterized membrane protein YdfJ with MMPL/SSD domain
MSLAGELGPEISKIRNDLLKQMGDARSIDDNIRAAKDDVTRIDEALRQIAHAQVSLKSAILITLDSLDRIDERLRRKPVAPP